MLLKCEKCGDISSMFHVVETDEYLCPDCDRVKINQMILESQPKLMFSSRYGEVIDSNRKQVENRKSPVCGLCDKRWTCSRDDYSKDFDCGTGVFKNMSA